MNIRSRAGALLYCASALVLILAIWMREPTLAMVPLSALVTGLAREKALRAITFLVVVGIFTSIVAAVFYTEEMRQYSLNCLVFFLGALCICGSLVFRLSRATTFLPLAQVPDIGGNQGERVGATRLSTIHASDLPAADYAASRAFWTGVTQVMSLRTQQLDGGYRWSIFRAAPVADVGIPIGELDTSAESRALTATLISAEAAGKVIAAAKVIEDLFGNGWALDPSGRNIYLPDFAQMTLGVTPEILNASCDAGDISWAKLLHPDEYEEVARNWRHSLATGEPFKGEFRIKRKVGFAWAKTSARCVRNDRGEILGWYGTSLDIDVQRKTLDALKERERELDQLVNAVPSFIWRLSPDGEPDFFNERTVEYLGIDVKELRGTGINRLESVFSKIIYPEDQPELWSTMKRSLATGAKFSAKYRLRRNDGAYRWMSTQASPLHDRDGKIVQWYGVSHDVDDQVQAEEALRRSEWHLQRVIEALPVHVCSWTPDGKLSYVNKRFLDDLGLGSPDLEQLVDLAQSRIHPEDAPLVLEKTDRALKEGEPFSIRYRRIGKDKTYRWADGRFEPLRNHDGVILEWYGLTIDVDDEMKVQESLRERERSLEQLVESLPTLIYCSTPDGKPIYRSQKLREFLGFNIEDKDNVSSTRLEGTLESIIHPEDLPLVREKYSHSLSTGTPYVLTHRLRRFDGSYRWVETRTAPMFDTEGNIVQWNGVCTDIDELIRAQEELVRAQRNLAHASQAASLAELTASIAHEVGQPLAALVSSSDACQQWLSADPPNIDRAQKALERVVRSATTATAVVTRIRALFKQSNDAKEETAFADVIANARDLMAEEAMRRSVRVQAKIDADLPRVVLDRIQIQQVLVNLVRNAMEAMEETEASASDRVVKISVCRVSDELRIEVRDKGPGVVSSEQIFDPFFTTKGDGMGMGLAICRTIVEAHGGKLWAESNEGLGAAFIFTLPLVGESNSI